MKNNFDQLISMGENFIVVVCFGDLKSYDFHYQIGLLQGPNQIETVKGKKLVKAVEAAKVKEFEEETFKLV